MYDQRLAYPDCRSTRHLGFLGAHFWKILLPIFSRLPPPLLFFIHARRREMFIEPIQLLVTSLLAFERVCAGGVVAILRLHWMYYYWLVCVGGKFDLSKRQCPGLSWEFFDIGSCQRSRLVMVNSRHK
eukprot:Gregarina_sp_Poly_1__10322@NODE_72_length_15994_cov_120_491179_g62_i0_p13_GENE_NODE_72_length_15994_cov_120_491179_g62_i0NODE_72_length_15994_cov_120_491179_g62_i0_p13_ORF_typecomplete_len128_score0_38AalphaY_MDB/PF04611_12/0_26_NODE_72_length_15994_cov_120_491179_g62_i062206603